MLSCWALGKEDSYVPLEIWMEIFDYTSATWSDLETPKCFWLHYKEFAASESGIDDYTSAKYRKISISLFGLQGVNHSWRSMVQKSMTQATASWSCKKFRSRFIHAASEGCRWDVELSYRSDRGRLLGQHLGFPFCRSPAVEALFFASKKSNSSIVEFLIENGADVQGSPPASDGPPPLAYIAWTPQILWCTPLCVSAEFSPGTKVMQILLENGAKVNARSPFCNRSPLQCAIQSSDCQNLLLRDTCAKVKMLLEYGADPALRGRDGEDAECLPLHSASSRGYIEIVELLLDHGARFDEQDIDDVKWYG